MLSRVLLIRVSIDPLISLVEFSLPPLTPLNFISNIGVRY